MKKLGLLAMAFALLMGMSQCKKENANTPANEGEKVPITLNVGGSAKHEVTPETGEVTFTSGDVLYVASNGIYVGALTYNGTQFVGEVTEPTVGQKLHFYFLGNVTPEESLTEGQTTGCSVVISDQTESLPVISYNASRENYQVGRTDYNATLLNKCALVKFDVTTASSTSPTCIKGMNNKVTVDFGTNEFDYEQVNEGVITMTAGSGEHWAILLPQDEAANAELQSLDGFWIGLSEIIPAITENDYLTEGIGIAMHPIGAINSLFTINANGGKAWFSQGNLQYIGSAGNGNSNNTGAYWKFAENQWDYLGTTTGQNSYNKQVDRDLFGWGTSGYNHGAECYQPWQEGSGYSYYYAYGNWRNNLYDQTGQADWGYNAIANGGNTENSGWRTPTIKEWQYVFKNRTASTVNGTADARFAKAEVAGVKGVILFPDLYVHPDGLAQPIGINDTGAGGWNDNNYSMADFVLMENHGAVFLPAAGYWNRYFSWTNFGSHGNYHTSSTGSSVDRGKLLFFGVNSVINPNSYSNRDDRRSVRLIINLQ